MDLFDPSGHRLYLTSDERKAFIQAASKASRGVRTFCRVLHDTGCRISEALALVPFSIDFNTEAIVFETLKKRRAGIYRAVPIPSGTLDTLEMVHGIKEALKSKKRAISNKPLWDWSRKTAYRRIKEMMDAAALADGPHKCPKGLRHGYGVHAINSGVP